MKFSLMKENDFSLPSKILAVACALILAGAALMNIWRGAVPRPLMFGIALVGCALFLVAKSSVIARTRWISFGTAAMSPSMARVYRAGYWLMAVGVLGAFA